MVPKEKGIVGQTVKDVLQMLVDDRLVTCEKIGTSNYYWSFPSAALHAKRLQLQNVNADIEKASRLELELKESIKKSMVGREETEERRQLSSEWQTLNEELKKVNAELDGYKENDPTLHAARINDNQAKKLLINKWTDNIDAIQNYCANHFGVPKEQLKEAFEIPSDLDYF